MRIELQLGYAVFSGYRRFGQLGGILFAIQAPSAGGHQMLAHVEAFIQAQLATFMSVDDEHLTTRVAPLKERMQADMGWQRQAEDAWAAVQAGFAPEYPLMLRGEIASLPNEALRAAAQQWADANCGRIVLSNDSQPNAGWSASRP
ncbi:hypothetical protein GCM10009304_06130 [Pseudomonas matsuisoli]|uniref:Coenzyme PQQ synthesis protein F-like C-terminal lobe domain-containing protein n=2 Tax=Pseudomonas matsuisoli TaxID=1515666 RepID=A0A917PLJ9_9PSED|nr:hypothetical protein GCM10009304_06130 [Pseudomonas matsuisoli]